MIVAIVGATGTGKSALSLDLAERLAAVGTPGEVVNADAMQLYRGMDIGTAKLSIQARRGIRHYLLDVLNPADEASVVDYQLDARAAIETIESREHTALLVGGSGLYVSSVINDFQFPGTDAAMREVLEAELVEKGPGILFARLTALDPAAAESIGPHNGRRIVRALEVIELTGRPFGAGLPNEAAHWRPTVVIGLRMERDLLTPRLDARVTTMWVDGLLDEVVQLGTLGTTAGRAIGYSQALAQLRGEISEAHAIEAAQALTRKYARRQVSWFRRYPEVTWLEADDPDRVEKAMIAITARATARSSDT